MDPNLMRPIDIVIHGFRQNGFTSEQLSMPTIHAAEKIVSKLIEDHILILKRLKASLPVTIRNTPHSCHTEEHCCSLHAAHRAAADKVEAILQDEILKLEGKFCPPLPESVEPYL